MRLILPYNKLDYDYFYPVHSYSINLFYNNDEHDKDHITTQCKSMVSLGTLNRIVADNNTNKQSISSLIKSHSTYLKSLSTNQYEVKILSLWTNPEINIAVKYILRNRLSDYTQTPQDFVYTLIYLLCILQLDSADIYMESEEILKDMNEVEDSDMNEKLQEMFFEVMNGFIQPITKTILNAPIVNVPFTCFRGCYGTIVKEYNDLKPNDFVIEQGFTTITWHPLAAGLSDTIADPITLMPIHLPKSTRVLSIYTASATPLKRELILPPGTVLMKTSSGVFVVIGIQKEFASLGSNENNELETYTNTIMNDINCSAENDRSQSLFSVKTTISSPMDDTFSHTNEFQVPLKQASLFNTFSGDVSQSQSQTQGVNFGQVGMSVFPNVRTKKYENVNGLFSYYTPDGMSLNTHSIDNIIVSLDYKALCKKYNIKTIEENEQGNKCTFFKQK